jgi:hypothetical protein
MRQPILNELQICPPTYTTVHHRTWLFPPWAEYPLDSSADPFHTVFGWKTNGHALPNVALQPRRVRSFDLSENDTRAVGCNRWLGGADAAALMRPPQRCSLAPFEPLA